MKKALLLLLAVCMIFTFAACEQNVETPNDATAGKDALIMGTNAEFPPYEYHEGGKIVGIDAEIAEEIAKKLDMELQIEDMEFNSIIAAIQTGKVSMGMAGMTVTEDRKLSVDFSDSYATGIQVIIVREDSGISTFEDLQDGKKVGVQENTTGDLYVSEPVDKGGVGDENVDRYSKGTAAVQALVQSKVDAVVIDNEPAKVFVAENAGLKILEAEYAIEDYAIAVSKDNPDLLEKINTALKELTDDGTVKRILDKYITAQ